MTWLKKDDRFPRHRKIRGLSNGAYRLHDTALCAAAENETDGLITAQDITEMPHGPKLRRYVPELVEAGLWHVDGDAWRIHDFLVYNPSHAELQRRREATRVRVERHRQERAAADGVTQSVTALHDSETPLVTQSVTALHDSETGDLGPSLVRKTAQSWPKTARVERVETNPNRPKVQQRNRPNDDNATGPQAVVSPSHSDSADASNAVTASDVTLLVTHAPPARAFPSRPVIASANALASTSEPKPNRDDKPTPIVVELCELLAARARANGHKATPIRSWYRACRLMLEADKISPEDIRGAILWATQDDFWLANIRSMPTLREKYSILRAQAQRPQRRTRQQETDDWYAAAEQRAMARDAARAAGAEVDPFDVFRGPELPAASPLMIEGEVVP